MNVRWIFGGCAVVVLSTASLWGQEEVQLRVRAIAQPDGKVEVVEETIEGKPNAGSDVRRLRVVKEYADKTKENKAESSETETAELPESEYWIGVQIGEVPPEVRKHMAVKHGILILHVYPESPAAKAELQVDDVLFQAGEAKIETAPDLIKAVDAAKTNELRVKVLREGSEKTLTIIPVERPDPEVVETRIQEFQPARLQAAERELQRALAKLQEANAERAVLDFMLVRPGAYVHGEALPKMPDDVSIQVTKEGSKPAKVVVKQGEKSYEATEGKLEAIPRELRPHVERMLSGAPSIMTVQTLPGAGQRFNLNAMPLVAGGKSAARVVTPVPVPPTPAHPVAPPAPAAPAVPGIRYYSPPAIAPAAPGTPAAPVSPRVAWLTRSALADSGESQVESKLDQILKKLDSLGNADLEEMKKELKSLRREVDALQKKATGSESSK